MIDKLVDMYGRTLDALRARRGAYLQTFGTPTGATVLDDLAKFCRAQESCFDPDPRIHAALEGRREVWLRIQQHIGLTSEQLFHLYGGPSAIQRQLEVADERDTE